jgi:hypothetical protein
MYVYRKSATKIHTFLASPLEACENFTFMSNKFPGKDTRTRWIRAEWTPDALNLVTKTKFLQFGKIGSR